MTIGVRDLQLLVFVDHCFSCLFCPV